MPNTNNPVSENAPKDFPSQHQNLQPGSQKEMNPVPVTDNPAYKGSGKLCGSVAIVTGGDSGIGQAVAIAFAKEGADILAVYYSEQEDASETVNLVQKTGRRCVLVKCDLKKEESAKQVVDTALKEFGRIDILVNNIAVSYSQNSIADITAEQLHNTFDTNIISFFTLTKAVLPHLKSGASIINTSSVSAFKGSPDLIDYSATKGAVVSFTRSLALSLVKNGIRVNSVAPGPVWTPLIPTSFPAEKMASFGKDVPMGRAAEPAELAPAYVFLASSDADFVTGQVLHVNGGVVI